MSDSCKFDAKLVTIRTEHRSTFEKRLAHLRPSLDAVRDVVKRAFEYDTGSLHDPSIDYTQTMYVAGSCAAWLLGRTSDFEHMTVFVTNTPQFPMRCEALGLYFIRQDSDGGSEVISRNEDLESFNDNFFIKYALKRRYCVENGPKINFTWSFNSIEQSLQSFDLRLSASAFRLYDPEYILASECECDYTSDMIRVESPDGTSIFQYPLVFDTDNRYFRRRMDDCGKLNKMLKRRTLPYIDDCAQRRNGRLRHVRVAKNSLMTSKFKRIVKYVVRVASANVDRRETASSSTAESASSLAFYTTADCASCANARYLSRKFADLWKHKTYKPPRGYGYLKCFEEFTQAAGL